MELVLLSLGALAQVAASPTGDVTEVVVFPDRATITRTTSVRLEKGANEVTFANLSPTLDLGSLQASGEGVEGSAIRGIDVRSRELAEDRRARVSELETQIRDLDDRITALSDEAAAATAELGFLTKIQGAAASQLSAELLFAEETAADAEAIAELLRARVPGVQETIRNAKRAARELMDERSALRRELSAVGRAREWSLRDVVVQIESPASGEAEVSISYQARGASWRPSYDARADLDEGSVELVMNAVVTQTTGEDWSDVALTLSTARPAAGIAPPELAPIVLEPVYPSLYDDEDDDMFADEAFESVAQPAKGMMAVEPEPAPEPKPMARVSAVVEEQSVASRFVVPRGSSIPGDGTRRKIRVTQADLESAFVHVVVPRREEAAYLVATSTWAEGWPLLAGEVSAFMGDSFVGTFRQGLVGKGGKVSLGFGRDDAVIVASEVLVDRRGSADWLGKVRHEKGWRYSVKNGRDEPIQVELRERLPTSGDRRIKVLFEGDEGFVPGPQGEMIVSPALAAGAESAIGFGYTVVFSKKSPPGGAL